MPLLEFLKGSPEAVASMSLEQIISACGDGRLRDSSVCSQEFREYLLHIDSMRLQGFIDTCVVPGAKQGLALQDLVNEIGRRLELQVEHGRYQGVTAEIGFDGIWRSSTGHAIVIESKTTDTYRINLDTVASYRDRLIDCGRIGRQSSILIVVLRDDTGDLEAQVRGSRHAWDIRIISVGALMRLLQVKELTESSTLRQIEQLLIPFEYTRLDRIIDITFAAVKDVEADIVDEDPGDGDDESPSGTRGSQLRSPKEVIEAARKAGIELVERVNQIQLFKRRRATYATASDEVRVACAVSKAYPDGHYWFAYHPSWDDYLSKGGSGFFVLSGIGLEGVFQIPREWIHSELDGLWKTGGEETKYWQIVLRKEQGVWSLVRRQQASAPLTSFWLPF